MSRTKKKAHLYIKISSGKHLEFALTIDGESVAGDELEVTQITEPEQKFFTMERAEPKIRYEH